MKIRLNSEPVKVFVPHDNLIKAVLYFYFCCCELQNFYNQIKKDEMYDR